MRNWNNPTNEERNELVFQKRNRDYGAYQIRTGYNSRMLLSMGLTFTLFITAALANRVSGNSEEVKKYRVETVELLEPVTDAKKKVERPITQLRKPESVKNRSVRFTVPIINTNAADLDLPPINDQIINDVSDITVDSEVDSLVFDSPVTIEGDGVDGNVVVDVLAMPQGGMQKFYEYVSNNFRFPNRCKEDGLNGYVLLRFKVDINGYISDVSAIETTADCPEFTYEAIRVLLGSPKWNPAQSRGVSVEAWRLLPIQLEVESVDFE